MVVTATTALLAWFFVPHLVMRRTLDCSSNRKFNIQVFGVVDDNSDIDNINKRPFRLLLNDMDLPQLTCETIMSKLIEVGLLLDGDDGPQNLNLIAKDFVNRPEVFSSLLMSDFDLSPLVAHQTRAAIMNQWKNGKETDNNKPSISRQDQETIHLSDAASVVDIPFVGVPINGKVPPIDMKDKVDAHGNGSTIKLEVSESAPSSIAYKAVVLNKQARMRRSNPSAGQEYGLPADYKTKFSTISSQLDGFYLFMTRPATLNQEDPIRPATADIYMRHARQFLGWYATTYNITSETQDDLSIYTVFPDKERNSADPILDFIIWLRSNRKISVSYEANFLRGLIKLLKFRFSKESQCDPSYGEKSFDDIPIIREVRKLHRDANKRQRVAPRSSDEGKKWISWPEYLQVVQKLQNELVELINDHEKEFGMARPPQHMKVKSGGRKGSEKSDFTPQQRKIATIFQRYLILAIFASVPDRQRTIRELEIGRSFHKNEATGCWCIKHAPEDYKTGKAYGERPLLYLTEPMTQWVDDFLEHWRQCFVPKSDLVFCQPKTGKPLTADSVYQIVSRACFQYTGKRTNPHLLRDMLVTHVRESDASEKQLEALALYMGHSIEMQRSSYDRRTLTKKVAPAVELLNSVNKRANHNAL